MFLAGAELYYLEGINRNGTHIKRYLNSSLLQLHVECKQYRAAVLQNAALQGVFFSHQLCLRTHKAFLNPRIHSDMHESSSGVSRENRHKRGMDSNECLEQACLKHQFSMVQNKNKKAPNLMKRQLPYLCSHFLLASV